MMEKKVSANDGVVAALRPRGRNDKFVWSSQSSAVQELGGIIADIAPTDIPVLVLGESGTGKEVVAIRIHQLSSRQKQPFRKLICTAVAADAFETLLAGQSTGAGSANDPSGAGTLFLDEISELNSPCQSRLLHALPDGEAWQGGRRLRARIISSSRRNLEEEVRAGRFREDLYYRLNDLCLRLPLLRQRKEDIPALLDFFLEKYAVQFARPKPTLSNEGMDRLLGYSWPGNIRQLENAAKKMVALGEERLALADLGPFPVESPSPTGETGRLSLKQAARAASQQAERELILRTLERTRWSRKRAAQELQISYKALLYKLKQIDLEDTASAVNPQGEQR